MKIKKNAGSTTMKSVPGLVQKKSMKEKCFCISLEDMKASWTSVSFNHRLIWTSCLDLCAVWGCSVRDRVNNSARKNKQSRRMHTTSCCQPPSSLPERRFPPRGLLGRSAHPQQPWGVFAEGCSHPFFNKRGQLNVSEMTDEEEMEGMRLKEIIKRGFLLLSTSTFTSHHFLNRKRTFTPIHFP